MFVTGWLSPTGELTECEYTEHIQVAEEICKKFGIKDTFQPDVRLLENGWCHLTQVSYEIIPKWAVFLPDSGFLSNSQKEYLKPLIEKYKDWIADFSVTDLKYEFPEMFE